MAARAIIKNDRQAMLESPTEFFKILIVDDDTDTHAISRLALGGFVFRNRPVRLFHAHSASEAYVVLCDQLDIAVALVDVVMETPDAGLTLVQRIRDELGNSVIRLILRTGQPGLAPELEVMAHYGINDYREKGDLTTAKLRTAVHAALSAYSDISEAFAERNRQLFGLQEIRADIETLLADGDPGTASVRSAGLVELRRKVDKLVGDEAAAAND